MSRLVYSRGHQCGARWPQVTRKDHGGRQRACSKNSVSMISVVSLTNINNRIIEGKLSKTFISEVCIKLVALRIKLYARRSSQFKKIGGPWSTG